MNIFDNIAKNVKKATVPAVESLTEKEIDGLAFAATTNEDYDTLGAAMEALGVDTVYAEDKVDKDDLTPEELRQLYAAGMEDEDPDDYEDDETVEALVDGYIDEAYADEASDAIDGLSEEDLEDIEDDEGMESYLSAEQLMEYEVAEEDWKRKPISSSMKQHIDDKVIKGHRTLHSKDMSKIESDMIVCKREAEKLNKKYHGCLGTLKAWEFEAEYNRITDDGYIFMRDMIRKIKERNEAFTKNGDLDKVVNITEFESDCKKFIKYVEDYYECKEALDNAKKSDGVTESFTSEDKYLEAAFEGLSDDEYVLAKVIADSNCTEEEINFFLAEEGVLSDAKDNIKKAVAENKARKQALADDAKTVTSDKKDVKKELDKSKTVTAKDIAASTARITALIAALKAVQKSGSNISQIDEAAKKDLEWFRNLPVERYDVSKINGENGHLGDKLIGNYDSSRNLLSRFKEQYNSCEDLIKYLQNKNFMLPDDIYKKVKTILSNEGKDSALEFVTNWAKNQGISNPSDYARKVILDKKLFTSVDFKAPDIDRNLFKGLALEIPARVNAAYQACGLLAATIFSGKIKAGVGFKVVDYMTASNAKTDLEDAARKSINAVKKLTADGKDATKVISATKDIIGQLDKLGSVLENEKNLDYAHSKYGKLIRAAKDSAASLTKDLEEAASKKGTESFTFSEPKMEVAEEAFADSNREALKKAWDESGKKVDALEDELRPIASKYGCKALIDKDNIDTLYKKINEAGSKSDLDQLKSILSKFHKLKREYDREVKMHQAAFRLEESIEKNKKNAALQRDRDVVKSISNKPVTASEIVDARRKKTEENIQKKIGELAVRKYKYESNPVNKLKDALKKKADESYADFSDEYLEELVDIITANESFLNVYVEDYEELCEEIIAEEAVLSECP